MASEISKKTILIGNGPSALNKKIGHIIDTFYNVIRFNTFYVKGYEEYVGSKTDIWVIHSGFVCDNIDQLWKKNSDNPRPKTVVLISKTTNTLVTPSYDQIKERPLPLNTFLGDEKVAIEADKYGNGTSGWVSTGFMAILEFSPCYIVGFDCFMSKDHHYVKDDAKNTFHSPEVESKFVREMVERGLVTRL